jgi:hypothetical protein
VQQLGPESEQAQSYAAMRATREQWEHANGFMLRRGKWRLMYATLQQIGWNAKENKPIYRYSVSIGNGADMINAGSRWLPLAWVKAQLRARMNRYWFIDKNITPRVSPLSGSEDGSRGEL